MIDVLNGGMKKQKIIVMIPAFNEEKTIGNVIKEIPRKINGISDIKVLVIDDGSTDSTIEVAKKAVLIMVNHATQLYHNLNSI